MSIMRKLGLDKPEPEWKEGEIVIPINQNRLSGEIKIINCFMQRRRSDEKELLSHQILADYMNFSVQEEQKINNKEEK